jgi:bleomycin hydrolase
MKGYFMKRIGTIFLAATIVCSISALGQTDRKDKAIYVEPKNEFFDQIKKDAEAFSKKEDVKKKELRIDLSSIDYPKAIEDFTQYWHTPPISQGSSGMCWCFSATSYYESEIYRLTKRTIKLSELYTVYWEYIEKAKRFVHERGNSEFGEGSESNAVPRIWKQYGIVPAEAYTGMLPGQKVHSHDTMFEEMRSYLASVKSSNAWDEEHIVSTIKSILDHYLGVPPMTVTVDGAVMTPMEYFKKVVRLNMDDYVEIMSTMSKPWYTRDEYEVSDNWWHNKDYCNVPLSDFIAVIKKAIRKGHTICIGGDTSEPGMDGHAGIAIVPSFDIPASAIDDNAREYRFNNHTSGDDHGIHMVGYLENNGKDWFLIKDSGSGSRNNSHPGYYFYSEDYVKLKMLGFTVHRSVIEDILKKFE